MSWGHGAVQRALLAELRKQQQAIDTMSLLRIICDGDDPTFAQAQSGRRALWALTREGVIVAHSCRACARGLAGGVSRLASRKGLRISLPSLQQNEGVANVARASHNEFVMGRCCAMLSRITSRGKHHARRALSPRLYCRANDREPRA